MTDAPSFADIADLLRSKVIDKTGIDRITVVDASKQRWKQVPLMFGLKPLLGFDFDRFTRETYTRDSVDKDEVIKGWGKLYESPVATGHKDVGAFEVASSVFPHYRFNREPFYLLTQYLYLAGLHVGSLQIEPNFLQAGGADGVPLMYLSRRSLGFGQRHRIVGALVESGHDITDSLTYRPKGVKPAGARSSSVFRRLSNVFPELTHQLDALFTCAASVGLEEDLCRPFDLRPLSDGDTTVDLAKVHPEFERARRLIREAKLHPGPAVIEALKGFAHRSALLLQFGGSSGVYTTRDRHRHLVRLAKLETKVRRTEGMTPAEQLIDNLRVQGILK